MPILHVRNVPEELHARIKKLAETDNISLSAEVVTLLDSAVQDRKARARQGRLLASIRRRRFVPPRGAPSSTELLREDRAR